MTGVFASTTCLKRLGYRETLDAYANAGLERVELGYCPEQVEVSQLVETYPFEWLAHNYCFPPADPFVLNLASPDETLRERSIQYVRDAVDFCEKHGIEQYTFHAGFRTDPDLSLTFPDRLSGSYESALERFCDSLGQIIDHVRATDIQLGVENNVVAPRNVIDGEPVTLLCRPGEIEDLFDRLGVAPNRLGVLLDTGHLSVSAETLGFDPERFVKEALSYTVGLHLHTNDGQSDEHRPLAGSDSAADVYRQAGDVPATTEARFDDVEELMAQIAFLKRLRSDPDE